MKRLKFLETKRTPRYSLRKFSVGVASVLLGVTIFGINLTDHSVKAATTESVETNTQKATSATEKVQQNGASNDVTEKVQQNSASNNAAANNSTEAAPTSQSSPETQGSASNNATANNSTEVAPTSQSAPKTQGSAHTDIKSLAAKSAAKLAFMNLMAASDTGTDTGAGTGTGTGTNTGSDRNAADTVDKNNINDQPAKENQKLANEHNLTSSDNYSSNIYQGKDGKYYKVVTIYGNDYVYHAADIQANGTAFGQWATTAEDTKNNINISKEDLGNGKTRWTVVFFPHKGLQNVGSNLSGLTSAKFGIALTNDYQIVGNVDMDVINDPNQTFLSHTFEPGSYSSTDIPVQNPPAEVKFSFNPKTDVDQNTGLINSKTMPAYNNKYLQGPYYFTTATPTGAINLWQTYFFNHRNDVKYYNAYDGSPYLGSGHDFHLNNFEIKNRSGVDGAKFGDKTIYDKLGYRLNSKNGVANSNGVVNSDNFNQAMEFKSQGSTGNSQTQFSSYVISFTTQHTDSHEVELATGWKNQQFSGISANIYSYQNTGYYNMFSRLYGEQRALNAAGATVAPGDVISGWGDANRAIDQMEKDYLNNAQINVLRNKILNNITDPDAVNNIIKEGNSLNTAMKNLGNSIGQYDPDGSFADHKEDTTKASDRYKYANPDKKAAYDNATEVTKALINKDTGTYADQATVEKLTEAENAAWSALDGVKSNADQYKPEVNTPTVDQNATVDPNSVVTNQDTLPKGTTYSWKTTPDTSKAGQTATGSLHVAYPDGSSEDVPVTVNVKSNADQYKPTVPGDKVTVKDPSHLTDDEKNQVKNNVDNANKDKFPEGTTVDVGDNGTATITYPDGSKDTIPGDQLVQGQKGDTTDAGNITPTVPGDKVTVKDPSHLTDDEKNQVKDNVDNANKDKFPGGTEVTVGDDGTATIKYPDGSKDTIPGDQLVQGQKSDTTDAGNITPTIPGGKVTVKDPSHLTDDEKNQVKDNVDNANKDKFPGGTEVTVGDDGTATIKYPDGSKDVIAGTDLVIAAKSEDVPGSKYHSHKNGSNSSQADRVKGASTANGSIANAGNNLAVKGESDNAFVGVKGESDNAIGNNKATSLKTLPQTGTKDTSILGVLGMLLASLGLFGFKKKRDKE